MATKKKSKTATYTEAIRALADLAVICGRLHNDAKINGDKIAMWAMGMIYEDMVQAHVRLGNIRLTIKGPKS